MPIANYQTPGVYVTQAIQNPVPAISNALNIAFFGFVPSGNTPTSNQQDIFLVTTSGNQIFTLSQSGTVTSFALSNNTIGTNISLSGTAGAVASGYNASSPTTVSGTTTFTVSGLPTNTWLNANYNYPTATNGVLYTFTNYQDVVRVMGQPFNYSGSTVTVQSPNTLAAYLAFQNGAKQVSCMNVIAASGGTASSLDYLNAIYSTQTTPGIDIIVPLTYDSVFNTPGITSGALFNGLGNYLTAQSNNGVYQRAFIGLDGTVASGTNQSLISTCAAIDQSLSNSAPQTITYNPGLNATTGVTTGTININGYYLAAAIAGLFTGQPTVATPITNKYVNGFVGIPNQISTADSNTLQSYGTTVVRQDRNANILVRQGLTTNITNYLTQEISVSAIGDQLVKSLTNSLNSSGLIGSPLTTMTLAAVNSVVTSVLNASLGTGLIQSYQNLIQSQDPQNPTRVNITFQYAPTLPLNYINVVFSINSSTGTITSTTSY